MAIGKKLWGKGERKQKNKRILKKESQGSLLKLLHSTAHVHSFSAQLLFSPNLKESV